MIENRKTYGLDVDKINTIEDVKNVFKLMKLIGYYDADDPNDENYYLSEYFTILQEPQGLTFSEAPPKTLDEIAQEFDEKIDKLIENTKNKFHQSKYISEKLYNTKFDKIIGNFEYAKEHGQFPYLNLAYTTTGLSAGSYETSFVLKHGSNHKGYYTMGNQRYFRYYMPDKPNRLVRFFMKTCLGLVWVDDKDT
jgi:hypothetical protein